MAYGGKTVYGMAAQTVGFGVWRSEFGLSRALSMSDVWMVLSQHGVACRSVYTCSVHDHRDNLKGRSLYGMRIIQN
jgi:hypothetical protein